MYSKMSLRGSRRRVKSSTAQILCLLLMLILTTSQSLAQSCFDGCEGFTLCAIDGPKKMPLDEPIILGAAGTASYPFVCRKEGKRTGHIRVLETGEAMVYKLDSKSVPVPISTWVPSKSFAQTRRFPDNYFGLYDIPLSYRMQGIGRIAGYEEDESLLNDLCVRLPIKSYQHVDDYGNEETTKISMGRPGECVSFQAIAPDVVAEFFWLKEASARHVDVKLSLTDKKGNELEAVKPLGTVTKCIGCVKAYWQTAAPGSYRISYTIETKNFLVRDSVLGRYHDCPGPYRQLMTEFRKKELSFVDIELRLIVRGKLAKGFPKTLTKKFKGDAPKSDSFKFKVRASKSQKEPSGKPPRPSNSPTPPTYPPPTTSKPTTMHARPPLAPPPEPCRCSDRKCNCRKPCKCIKNRCQC